MAKMPSAQKEAFWRQTLSQFAQSGLSARDFCNQQNLPLHSFYFWKRNISKRDIASSEPAARRPTIVPVSIVNGYKDHNVVATNSPMMRISLPGNIVVEIFKGDNR
jgi:hypothetical protein